MPQDAEELLERIGETNKFLNDYIKKLRDRNHDIFEQLQQEIRKGQEQEDQIVYLKQSQEETQLKYEKEKTITQNLKYVFKQVVSNQREINKLIRRVDESAGTDEGRYDIHDEETIIDQLQDCAKLNYEKLQTLNEKLENFNSADSTGDFKKILAQTEQVKETLMECYEEIIELDIDDESGANKDALEQEEIIDSINKNVNFILESLEELSEQGAERINILIEAKKKILEEKEGIQS
jgi:hypothetical protein